MTATVSWTANTEPDLAGYHIYIGHSRGIYDYYTTAGPTATSFVFGGLSNQDTYFAVTAYDTSGNESAKSTEVSKCQLAALLMARMG